jgi:hypothetical protein
MTRHAVVGTWRLEVWEARDETGQVSYPRGCDDKGYLTYTEDGYVFVAIMTGGRALFATTDLVGGTPLEKAHAAETYTSYCGCTGREGRAPR